MKFSRLSQLAFITVFVALAENGNGQTSPNTKPEFIESTLPAVVRIDTPLGHGTGFFISNDGWIVTNHHVIANAPIDPNTGYQFCRLTLAKLNENAEVELVGRQVWGTVYKVSKRSDLALIRADELPAGIARSPFFRLSEKQGKLGDDCFTIGMPARGVNWAIRKGVVSGHGLYPDDFEMGAAKIASTSQTTKAPRDSVSDGSYRVTITTCGVNPGDSGGPVFNANKEIIAVNKAIPLVENQVNLDKFTYHIHLNEVADFVRELPDVPEISPPALKPQYLKFSQVVNKDGTQKSIQLVNPKEELVVIMMDIDAKGPTLELEPLRTALHLSEQDFWKKMSVDWAFIKSQRGPTAYFFDLNSDGNFEQVFVSPIDDGASATQYTFSEGKWKFASATDDFLDRVQFESSDVQRGFVRSRQELAPKIKR